MSKEQGVRDAAQVAAAILDNVERVMSELSAHLDSGE